MSVQICAVYDAQLEAYLQPFFSQTEGTALRSWRSSLAQTDHTFAKHAQDYSLFLVGEYDQDSGEIAPVFPPRLIETGLEGLTAQGRVPDVNPQPSERLAG